MAQSVGGAIAGVARDTSGAVLPGVTVEVASPALIEGVRTVVTDEQGAYRILELRPGTYTVTFTLPGFSVVKREGLELNSGFTATMNGDMQVGGLEETITVQGASPVVDTENVRQQTVFTRELLDSLPTNRSVAGFATLTLGAQLNSPTQQNVGGDKSEAASSGGFTIHVETVTVLCPFLESASRPAGAPPDQQRPAGLRQSQTSRKTRRPLLSPGVRLRSSKHRAG